MEGNNQNRCDVCGSGYGHCGKCGNMCGYNGKHLLRWFLGVIIITWVFSIGMKIGELKASIEGYGYGHRAMPMMYGAQSGWSDGNVMFTTTSAPATMMTGVKGGTIQVIKGN
ncbi:MAG: hypothetical protein AB201_01320 [Parcubacteria bacterium C7867-006]|nr:MAG: hypothetical protein AB201_01320 [Parcubacteria bacterium C7867-006]